MKTNILLTLILLTSVSAFSQNLTQTIRGRVVDKQSEVPLPGVNVVTLTEPRIGTTTDENGYYQIENVPVQRITLSFSFIGYQPVVLQSIELSSSKELVQNVAMLESTEQLDEVVVKADNEEDRVINERVNVSGRSFTVEETMRFAGSVQDVSRMASNFAGVQRTNDANNDIVIRGNSPIGLIWRLEGMDIPNPNHFGGLGATGGPVSMLNNNVLANSDFITGAFPSEYGDGLSGVFDLSMRNGNYENHEFLGQVGFNGFELGAEGPISRENRFSYLVNYRYSTLGLMSAIGLDFGTGTAVPKYQDLNIKLHFPSSKRGTIDVFALGGISSIEFLESENEEGEDGGFYSDGEDLYNDTYTGVIGASHQYFFNKDLYSKFSVALSSMGNDVKVDTLNTDRDKLTPTYRQSFQEDDLQFSGFVNKKFNVHHVLRAGAYVTYKNYNLGDSTYDSDLNAFRTLRDQNSSDWLYQPYVNWQYRITDKWEMNTGLHAMVLASNGNYSIEPRFGMSYQLTQKQSINLGYGKHSQAVPVVILYEKLRLPDGSYISPNENLDFTKSHHFVLGYDLMMKNRLHFKAEAYYQHLYDAVVTQMPSSFSSLNAGGFDFYAPDSVENGGAGCNYGLDLTLEKFMDKGFYFLSTISLYQSQYQGSDEVWRNTAFNGNYVANLLGGKEFVLGKKKQNSENRKTITLDGKVTYAGGQRYTPIDLQQSIIDGEAVYAKDDAYGAQFDPYFRADIRIGYKVSGKKVTQELALDIQNVTNSQNPFGVDYNKSTQEVETTYQLGIFPMVLYRITF
ncbi:hypothetical protein Oweho_1711 [Owenweeksia hongkongensis DSM 17368]|uniref:Outer membrane receptor protein n=1 Tax=Owenweeksia hongkongensis (strain DSM 17368 / CIP 108786 / JCM 12287 / NRRL B-23963 / UST20020801) TaxID=926562 RepID=G8R0J5_OWEHD|nr:TonB-dependent receptor [Owenweeksia hongkongensis]AEV32699.1 hypothetical protein Oweho_1711 [Owenweeksia hongkongensis DSM 17368]